MKIESVVPRPYALPLQPGELMARAVGRNTVFSLLGNLAQMATKFATVPVIIRHLGLDGYGIWAVLMSIAAYMSLGAAGVKSAFQKYCAEATATGDFARASRLVSTGVCLVLVCSLAALAPVAIFSRSLAAIAGVPTQYMHSAAESIRILAVGTVIANAGSSYGAILMGAHRIDLRRKIEICGNFLVAITVILLLQLGFGLVALSMAFSIFGLLDVVANRTIARRLLPAITISRRYITTSVLRELATFGGTYQLVSVLETLYAAVLPVLVLRFYGANAAGILAIAIRIASAALLPQNASLQPILSGGSFVHASGATDGARLFLLRSFRATFAMSFAPLAFTASLGTIIAVAWTGKSPDSIGGAIAILCLGALFKSISSLARVLYRSSGRCLMDNIQIVSMLVILVPFSFVFRQHGLLCLLSLDTACQFVGMIIMLRTIAVCSCGLSFRDLASPIARFAAASVLILAASFAAAHFQVASVGDIRLSAFVQVLFASVVGVAVAGPALLLTGAVSRKEATKLTVLLKARTV
jgi:O-antigen/teichoic acid export membrane protein